MDLLFRRYASPFLLLDGVISSCELCEFIDVIYEQKKEEEMWDFYINKLPSWDERTYEEFKNSLKPQEIETASKEELETTVSDSYNMMMNFKLEEGG